MSYLGIPREFFKKACKRVQYIPREDESVIYFDLSSKHSTFLNDDRNRQHLMVSCGVVDTKGKDIIDLCYECMKQDEERYGKDIWRFDGEKILVELKPKQ